MSTPIKIYVRDWGATASQVWTSTPGKRKSGTDVEYIRKDEVAKLIEQEKEDTGIGTSEYDAGHENGRMEVIISLSEKLNAI